ncbi:MAG: hypothetical protein OXI23_15745, partial [Gemmatimonadota bacterium]|nr:hypothetical protein [Gemmatimonadota bacterium]
LPVPTIRRFATRAESMTCVKFFSKNIELFHSLSSGSIESNDMQKAKSRNPRDAHVFFYCQRLFGRCTRWKILVLISDCHRGMLKAAIQEVFS